MSLGRNRWPLVLLGLAVITVFCSVCGHEFLDYDDNQNITQNALITTLTPANLLFFWKKPFAGMYIPLTYNFWALQAKLASFLPAGQATALSPYLFHTVNLLLHLANAMLVFSLIRRFVHDAWAALLGALLFALHPVQVEPVAWITGCKDLLSGFFSLLALRLYVDYAQSPAGRRGQAARYLLALAAFLAALLAKPGAVVVPLLAGVIGRLLLRRTVKQLIWELIPWICLILPIAVLTRMAQPDTRHGFLPTVWQRLLISGDSLSFYLLKLLAPLKLGPDYGRTPQYALGQDWLYLTGLLPFALIAAIVWKARPAYRAATGLFVIVLLPVSGIINFTFQGISTVADRYLYLAMLGPALAAGFFLQHRKSRLSWGIGLALLALFGMKSASQVRVWQDSITFNQHALAVNPRSWTAYGNLGNDVAKQNRQAEAIRLYQQALALKPDDEKTTFNLGLSYSLLNQSEAAIAAFHKTLAIVQSEAHKDNPYKGVTIRDAYFNLGAVYAKGQRLAEAIDAYRKTVAIAPDFVFAYANLGDLYAESGQMEAAIAMYQKALSLDPTIQGVTGNLGLLLAEQGNLPAAISHFQKALSQAPDDLPIRLNLGLALYHQNDFSEASRQLLQVTQAKQVPVEIAVEAYNALGALYMAQGRRQEAVDALRTVLRYAPGHQFARENLDKVLTEMGQGR